MENFSVWYVAVLVGVVKSKLRVLSLLKIHHLEIIQLGKTIRKCPLGNNPSLAGR